MSSRSLVSFHSITSRSRETPCGLTSDPEESPPRLPVTYTCSAPPHKGCPYLRLPLCFNCDDDGGCGGGGGGGFLSNTFVCLKVVPSLAFPRSSVCLVLLSSKMFLIWLLFPALPSSFRFRKPQLIFTLPLPSSQPNRFQASALSPTSGPVAWQWVIYFVPLTRSEVL